MLNDRIINVAMTLMRNSTCEQGIGGLQDAIIGSARRFSDSGGTQPGFVQIINVCGNLWITVSNLPSSLVQTCIYESYLELNVKKEQKKVSYPLTVDKAASELAKRDKCFTMLVEEIQQQVGGDDCGLFAIAFAVMLCFNEDPCKATYDQNIMRRELVTSFEAMDFEKYKTSMATRDNSKQPKVLYEWTCQVHCTCHRPVNGKAGCPAAWLLKKIGK